VVYERLRAPARALAGSQKAVATSGVENPRETGQKLGTDGKFPVLGSATELPRIAAPGLGVLNVNYSESGQAPHVGKVAENVPSVPHTLSPTLLPHTLVPHTLA